MITLPRKISRWLCLSGSGCLLSALVAGAAPANRAPIQFPPLAREELVAATLSSNVFAASRDDYTDLRVLDDAGQAVPFVLQTLTTRKTTTLMRDCPAAAPQARELENQALELTFALLPDVPSPTSLTIETPLRDFQQRVQVEGSVDGITWQVLVNSALLYDLSRFVDVRQCDVSWGANNCRRFRVTFFDATRDRPDTVREVTSGTRGTNVRQNVRSEPFRVQRVRLGRAEPVVSGSTPVRVAYPLSYDEAASKKEIGQFVFRSSREPLTQIVLSTTNRLFHRSYRLYGRNEPVRPGDDAPGLLLASGVLTQIRFQEISRTDMTIDFPLSRFREYVLVAETAAGDATGLALARAEGVVPRIIFAAVPDRTYALLFGDSDADYPVLPETAALQTLVSGNRQFMEARVGDATGAPGAPRSWKGWLNSTAVMIGAMAIAGLLLTLMLISAGRKMNEKL